MFFYATAFDKVVIGWNVCKVSDGILLDGNFYLMFHGSGQSGTNLEPPANGECIPCPANTTSGSGEYVQGQNPCTVLCLDNGSFGTALDLWFSNSTLATITYGNITDW